jgi:putative FmdB family regulatory protein
MPIYVFRCQDCTHTFDELVMSTDAAAALVCPKCGSRHLARQPAVFATTSGGRDSQPSCGSGDCSACPYDD